MAIVAEEEEKKVAGAPAEEPAATTTTSAPTPTAGTASAGATTAAPTAGTGKPTSSGSFVDIGKYYEAGKGKAQSQGSALAGTLGSGVQAGADTLKKAADTYASGLGQYKAKDTFSGQDLRTFDRGAFEGSLGNINMGQADLAAGQGQISAANKKLQDTSSLAGQQEALRSIAGRGYGSGEQRLDSALLGYSERDAAGGAGSLAAERAKWAGQGDTMVQAARDRGAAARGEVQGQREGIKKGALEWLAGQGGNIQNRLDSRSRDRTAAARESYINNLRGAWDTNVADKRATYVDQQNFADKKSVAEAKAQQAAALQEYRRGGSKGEFISPVQGRTAVRPELAGPKNFSEAMLELERGGFGSAGIQRGAGDPYLNDPAMQKEMADFEALSGQYGAGRKLNRGTDSAGPAWGGDQGALQALKNMIRYRG